jgi:hypothetical protein
MWAKTGLSRCKKGQSHAGCVASAITATGGIDPFQCNPNRARLSKARFQGTTNARNGSSLWDLAERRLRRPLGWRRRTRNKPSTCGSPPNLIFAYHGAGLWSASVSTDGWQPFLWPMWSATAA